jgi:hypothetical protein
MNFGCGVLDTIIIASKKLWCLAAISIAPEGGSPLISVFRPIIQEADQVTYLQKKRTTMQAYSVLINEIGAPKKAITIIARYI